MSLKSIAEEEEYGEEMMNNNDHGGCPGGGGGSLGADSINKKNKTKRQQQKDGDHTEEETDDLENLQDDSGHQSSSQHGNDYSSVGSPFLEEDMLHRQQQLASLPELGPGPARFEPPTNGKTLEEQVSELSDHDKNVVRSLKSRWEQTYPEVPFTDRMYLQFARYSSTGESNSRFGRVVGHHNNHGTTSTPKKTMKVAATSSTGTGTGNTPSSVSSSTKSSSTKRRWGLGGLMKRRGRKGTGNNHEKNDGTDTEKDDINVDVEGNNANDTARIVDDESTHKNISKKPNLFHEREAWEAMNNFDHHYLSLTVEALDTQLRSKTLFPVPRLKGLKSSFNHHRRSISTRKGQHHGHGCQELPMFYMRPSRYFPNSTPIEDVIDNLAYVMQSMTCSDEGAQTDGVGFIANMDGWTFQNFSVEYCSAFMSMLQGQIIPVHVELFLIVDPPTWFPTIWKIMKPMLSGQFRRKVKMIPSSELSKHLCEGYEKFLPDEMQFQNGQANTTEIVRDFITYRQHVEELDAILAESNDVVMDSSTSKSVGGGGMFSSSSSLPSSINKEPVVPDIILTT